MTTAPEPCSPPASPAQGDGRKITPEVLKALQRELGKSWVVGTGSYPEGRRITAMPWPPTWAPAGKIVIGKTAAEVRAEVKRRKESGDGS